MRVRVSDISGSRINEVEAPDDVEISRILVVLVERMNLPLNSPDGQLMSYKLHHRRTGSQLLDNQSLGQANVVDGDELRLQPEITAGGAVCDEPDRGVHAASRAELFVRFSCLQRASAVRRLRGANAAVRMFRRLFIDPDASH
jgi:hypothetical protein